MSNFPPTVFSKTVIIKDKEAVFTHGKENYRLTAPFFDTLEGKTVLINGAFEIERGGKKIGNATRVK